MKNPFICSRKFFLLACYFLFTSCFSAEPESAPFPSADAVVVDLIDPIYSNGILTTEQGGVLLADGLRIQAEKITYIKQLDAEVPVFTVKCEGNLLIDYHTWVLTGDTFFYDFFKQEGVVQNGRTAVLPWFMGGEEIQLQPNGNLIVINGFLTTSEGDVADLVLCSPYICLSSDQVITAKHIHVKVNQIPIFWFPFLSLDINALNNCPFSVKFGWQGFMGSYVSFLYKFISWRDLRATARFDAFFGKGVGFGIETAYTPKYRPLKLCTRNYYAHDIALDDPKRHDRYRFQGTYLDCFWGTTAEGTYDVVSDAEMAADYTNLDFNLPTAGRTQLLLRTKQRDWIASLFTRVRVNTFQSINQELPSFQLNLRPWLIPYTGMIFQNTVRASYLSYVFSEAVVHAHDFASGRFSIHPFVYRPFIFPTCTLTPEAGLTGIGYTNSRLGKAAGQMFGILGARLDSTLYSCNLKWKHAIEPYLHYTYITHPSAGPDDHYIFTIDDGWNRLNQLRFGVRNSWFTKVPYGVARPFWVDLWANAFFATKTIPEVVPKAYLNAEWLPSEYIFVAMNTGWNFQHRQLDFLNIRVDWTLNENLAFGLEYRHRSRYDWRKADFYNFILESTRSQAELLDSPLKDRNDMLLFRIFTRLSPDWTAKFQMRHGWHREFQSPFFEYKIDLSRLFFQHWRLTGSYEHREADDRVTFTFLLDPVPPPCNKACY